MKQKKMESSILCPEGSVGAIFKKGDEYLVLYRKVFPTGLAFIAGHRDESEDPDEALKREVLEESGIVVKKFHLVLNEIFPNPCKRGFSQHEWWVYEVFEWEREPRVMEPEKHLFVKFMPEKEIKKYSERNDFDPAWKKFILPALKIL